MKIPARVVDGPSVCSAVLSNCRSATTLPRTGNATTPIVSSRRFGVPSDAYRKHPSRRQLGGGSFFCSRTSHWLYSTFTPISDPRTSSSSPSPRRDAAYTTTAVARKPVPDTAEPRDDCSPTQQPQQHRQHASPVHDRGELLSYVPLEGQSSVDEHFDFYRDPFRRGYAQPDGPKLLVSEKRLDVEYPPREDIYAGNDKVRASVASLCSAIGLKMRHPHRSTLESVYKLYLELPEPRMLNLTGQWRNRLLRIMGTPPRRNLQSMLRYFALVADTKNAGLTLRRTQWNYALAFATKYTARAGMQEADAALRMWREMERDAKIPGNDVTFNVLFDVAAKAGNFTLAEMLYNEMDNRGIEFNRFHHVSLIFFFGLKLDSSGIRAAYREMVESGEMIDTVTLNCVISGFLRCGEEAAAEETYRRMRGGNTPTADMPERDYMTAKVVTKVLMMFSKVGKDHPQLKQSFQTNVQLAPDLRTYRILIEHYAVKLGDLSTVARYLDEMRFQRIAVHPTIFLALFKGFYVHGGFPGSQWSTSRLEGVLKAMREARDGNARGFLIDRWLVIWALRAVGKCSTPDAVIETFDDLAKRWDVAPSREPFLHALLDNIVRGRDLKSKDANDNGTLHRGYNAPNKRPASSEYKIPY
ncbi:PPR repeat [Geosmithia morbida]|uniref:PPR repeat n=1 Tax=Geosmithia morbida TaxID=1094350 RepID=A0A9P4YQ13_9HYPO|nr:PPR repeat [Geosmithia morbida]KAF4119516.1 PPR repeat [Geosmithia morbida]